jgi:hypothetical protein
MAYDTRADALDLGVIGLEPTVTNEQIGFRVDGKKERNDFYKFTLEQESDFNLSLDRLDADANVQVLDSDGSIVFQSRNKGGRREVIDENLEAGEYFVRVLPRGAAQTDYRLSLNADPIAAGSDDKAPGTSLGVLNSLTEETVINDEIGFTRGGQRDENDFFSFTLDKDSDVSLTLDQLKRDANVEILDGDGETVLLQSLNKGRQEETINAILEQGDYVVRVLPQGAAKTSYRLELSADEVLPPEELPGAAVGDLTTREEPVFAVEDIGFGRGTQRNQKDYYSFSLGQDASFFGELDQLQRNANLYLYEYDPSKGKNGKLGSLLANSRVKGNKPDTISEFLEEGDYAVQVRPQGAAKTDYRLELDAQMDVDDIPTRELAEDLGELVAKPTNRKNNVGLLTNDRFRDQEDWFKFTLSEEKNVDLTTDEFRVNAANIEIYDSEGERLYRSRNRGRSPELINETFDAGDYYVRVVATGSGNTDYRLSLSAEKGLPTYDVFELGDTSSKTDSNNDNVGQERSGVRNEFDVYNFSVGALTDVNFTLDQIQQNVNLELYQGTFDPEDRRAKPVSTSSESGRTEELIGEVLDSGNYHLRVIPVGNAETRYRLGIETEPAVGGEETEEVGSLISLKNSEYKNRDRIGFTQGGTRNENDFYNFSLDSQSNFTLTLDEIKRDANVMVLDSEGEMVLSGFNPGNAPEFVNGTLEAGDYTVQVFPVGSSKTNYFLKMNADPITGGGTDDGGTDDGGDEVDPITGEDPDGTPATAVDLGSDLLTQSGKVGFTEDGVEDASDYYKFTVAETDDVQIILDGMNQNADLTLLDDDGAAVLLSSSNSGTNSEVISTILDAGDYYLRVDAVGSAQTDYTVQFL